MRNGSAGPPLEGEEMTDQQRRKEEKGRYNGKKVLKTRCVDWKVELGKSKETTPKPDDEIEMRANHINRRSSGGCSNRFAI